MSENLRSLLKGADHPRSPTPAELNRIRTRVLDRPVVGPAELITLQPQHNKQPPHRRWLAAIAAGFVLLALVAGVAQLRGDDQADVAVVPPPPPVCEEVHKVDLALDSWRTIDDWARLGATDPDLAAEVAGVLAFLSPPEVVTNEQLDRSLEALKEASAPGSEGQRTAARTAAVTEAMQLAITELEGTSTGCDLELWKAAME